MSPSVSLIIKEDSLCFTQLQENLSIKLPACILKDLYRLSVTSLASVFVVDLTSSALMNQTTHEGEIRFLSKSQFPNQKSRGQSKEEKSHLYTSVYTKTNSVKIDNYDGTFQNTNCDLGSNVTYKNQN